MVLCYSSPGKLIQYAEDLSGERLLKDKEGGSWRRGGNPTEGDTGLTPVRVERKDDRIGTAVPVQCNSE